MPYLHSSFLYSYKMTQQSIYLLLDYNTPLLINYRNRHLLQLHTRDHLQHKHLKKGRKTKLVIDFHTPPKSMFFKLKQQKSRHMPFTVVTGTILVIVAHTCIPSAHVHVCNLLPGTGNGVKHFNTFSYQRTIMTTYCIQ